MKFTLALLALALLVSGAAAHNEDDHDDFAKEFGDENEDVVVRDGNTFSEGTEEDHVEVREQSTLVKPTSLAKDLPQLRFLYCVSCGYKQAFDQFTQYVHDKYPNMPIEGANYPSAAWKTYVAQFINIAKIALIVTIVTGSNPLASLGYAEPPAVVQWAHGNKLSACMMLFMLSNMVEGSLLSTGAFEIYLGEERLWSKIESGRVPAPGELIQMIDSQLELLGKIPSGGGLGFNDDDN